jgi:hypothetical protein
MSTVADLKKFLKCVFRRDDIVKIVWGRQLFRIDDDKQLISSIIDDLKNRTNGVFSETNTLVVTFNMGG